MQRPFHLAFPVHDLGAARAFYGDLLGCPEGRSSPEWIDFDLFGHQIVAHLAPDQCGLDATNVVDGDQVPVRHFGVVLPMPEWQALADKLTAVGTKFIIEPASRAWPVNRPPFFSLTLRAMPLNSRRLPTSDSCLRNRLPTDYRAHCPIQCAS